MALPWPQINEGFGVEPDVLGQDSKASDLMLMSLARAARPSFKCFYSVLPVQKNENEAS